MSPHDLAGLGLLLHPGHRLGGHLVWNCVGDRFLNKRNTALAKAYATVALASATAPSRFSCGSTLRTSSDARAPVSESELGDSQYYRLPARSYELSGTWRF